MSTCPGLSNAISIPGKFPQFCPHGKWRGSIRLTKQSRQKTLRGTIFVHIVMIRLENVTKSYGNLRVIDSLSMSIEAGKLTVLIGPSGCGKTTLLEMMNGLIPPDSGDIWVGNENLKNTDMISLRKRIGYVIQEVGLFPHYTVFDNIALVPRLLKWEESRIRARVAELTELVNIPNDRLNQYPAQLSGGQQQRVGVARALAADPDYLLMDEPFSAIDPINRERLQDEFLSIQQRLRKTVVFVTHDMNEAIKMGDKLAILQNGMLLQYASPLELLLRPANQFVAHFVGKHRHLKSLRFLRIGEVFPSPQYDLCIKHSDMNQTTFRRAMEHFGSDFIFVIDDEGKYMGYIQRMKGEDDSIPVIQTTIAPLKQEADLQFALEQLLAAPLPALPVITEGRKYLGSLSVTRLQEFLSRTTTEL